MSLEIAIQENTQTMRELIAALNAMGQPAPAAPVKETKPKATKAEVTKPEPVPVEETKPEPAPVEETKAAPTYDETAKALVNVSKTLGREAAIKLLAGFDASNLKEVSPDRYPEVIAACQEALEGAAA